MRFIRPLAVLVALFFMAAVASAGTITPGFTFAVASGGGAHATGTHFHSNTGGAYGNPAGKAEVGAFVSEEVRGLSEYNLAGLSAGPAFVTFNVYKAGGLFTGTNDFPFTGTINVYAYQGNNTEDIADYQASSVGFVGSFGTAGLLVGNVLSFDITSIFGTAIAGNWSSLGMRLQDASDPTNNMGAWTFDTFRLTSTNDTTPTVPEPTSLLLLGTGLMGAVRAARRKRS